MNFTSWTLGPTSPQPQLVSHDCNFKLGGRVGGGKVGERERGRNYNLASYVTIMALSYSLFSGTRRVHANEVYQQYIKDKNHFHMNATRVGGHVHYWLPLLLPSVLYDL